MACGQGMRPGTKSDVMKPDVRIKRAYEPAAKADGYRVLVDRLWPRGVKREALAVDEWAKDVSPGNELRRRFHHDPGRWGEFVTQYRSELASGEGQIALARLKKIARTRTVTLVYAARDTEHNNAAALRTILTARASGA
jgi:uncharacterized protein YeaO (DUF488 family)